MAINSLSVEDKIVITGSRGFIGRRLLATLHNFDVVPFHGNLLVPGEVETFFSEHKPTQAVHLVGGFDGPFEQLLQKNVLPTQNLLETGWKHGLRKIIYASTGAVYGEPVKEKSVETDPLQPNTLYGLSKKFAEEVTHFYKRQYGIENIILRFPNVYGAENNKGVLFQFLQAIKTKGSISIAGDGSQSRNFLHVQDACNAIEKALHYNGSGIFNISNPVKVSINELVEQMKQYYTFGIEHRPQDNYLKDLLLDTSKAQEELGFQAANSDLSRFFKNPENN